jgi:hypothetical protein
VTFTTQKNGEEVLNHFKLSYFKEFKIHLKRIFFGSKEKIAEERVLVALRAP